LATILSKYVDRWIADPHPQETHTGFFSAADFKVLLPVATSWLSIAVFTDG